MKLRKLIALVATVLLLAGMLPLSAVVAEDSTGANLLKNGNFESGDANWTKLVDTVSVVDDPTGSGRGKVMMTNENGSQVHMFQQDVSGLTAYTDYVLKFKVYTYAADGTKPGFWATLGKKTITYNTSAVTCYPMEVKTVDSSSSTRVRFTSVLASAYNTWIDVEIPFNTNTVTSTTIMFSNYRGSAGQYYFDDIQLYAVGEPEPPNSDAGKLKNGSFETGDATDWQTWQSTTISTDAAHDGTYGAHLKGDGGWGGMLNQTVAVQRGAEYTLSFWLKVNAVGVNFQLKQNNNSGAQIDSGWYKIQLYGEWTLITYEFVAPSNNIYLNFCGSGKGTAEDAYVDNFTLTKKGGGDPNALVQNGGFETGSLSGWKNLYSACTISFVEGRDSKYALKFQSGQWQQVRQDGVAVEPYADYLLTAYVKNANNFTLMVKKGDDSGNIASTVASYTDDWTKLEVSFSSGTETEVCILLMGNADGASALIDDVVLTKVSGGDEGRNQLLTDGGTSIRDTDSYKRGLAFRFSLAVSGAQVTDEHKLTSGVGSLDLFEANSDVGTLIETGAVVTNVEAIGNSNMTFADVDGKKTVKVPAVYALESDAASVTFAVRVVNIPDANSASLVYARPYYTYELNGQQTTVYGDIYSNSYDAIVGAKTDLKILAIGDDTVLDATYNHLYDLLKSAGYTDVVLGNLCAEAGSLDEQWSNVQNGNAAYTFYKHANDGQWVTTKNQTLKAALKSEEWDVIVIQQSANLAGVSASYGRLEELVNWIEQNKTNVNGKIYWNMAWAADGDNDGYAAIADAARYTAMQVENIDGILPTGTAIQSLRTGLPGDTLTDGDGLVDTYGDYAAAMTWYAAISGKSLDKVTYIPDTVSAYHYDIARAAAHAVYAPYAAHDLTETVLFAGSDFQPTGYDTSGIRSLLGSLMNEGYGLFDGFLMVGDYTPNNSVEESSKGLAVLDNVVSDYINFGKIYSQGNHDASGTEGMCASGNNDPLNATYGVFVINEDDYDAYGVGGQQVAADLTAYFNEKLENGWGNKPIFVMSHLPLHYNYRTIKDKGAATAMYVVDALNAASDAGLNIIFLIAHNHSGGYDDYLGGAAIYIPKGDSILVADPANYKNAPIETELRFTYMNAGYIAAYVDMGQGADTALTVSVFRIQENGDVIITRYDKNGEHNLKSAGALSPHDREYTQYTEADDRVYESSRIVGAFKDEEYTG